MMRDYFSLGFKRGSDAKPPRPAQNEPPPRVHKPRTYYGQHNPAEIQDLAQDGIGGIPRPDDIRPNIEPMPWPENGEIKNRSLLTGPGIIGFIVGVLLSLFFIYLFKSFIPSDTSSNQSPTNAPPLFDSLFHGVLVLGLLVMVLALLSTALHTLRRLANPLYWELGCWTLLAVGVLVRPLIVSSEAITIAGVLVAGCAALIVFPLLMRFLNKLKPEPGLSHVALPFSLGFFLDIAQLFALTYVPDLGWGGS